MKPCLYILSGLFLLAGCAHSSGPSAANSPWPADAPETHGTISAYIVTGIVQLRAPDGTEHVLKRGDKFEEGNALIAEPGAGALLVFSNGSTLKVTEGTELAVVKFRQTPFDEKNEGTYLRLSKDPSRSNVLLELRKGTLQGEVKELNTGAGSTFFVQTPKGPINLRSGPMSNPASTGGTGAMGWWSTQEVAANDGRFQIMLDQEGGLHFWPHLEGSVSFTLQPMAYAPGPEMSPEESRVEAQALMNLLSEPVVTQVY